MPHEQAAGEFDAMLAVLAAQMNVKGRTCFIGATRIDGCDRKKTSGSGMDAKDIDQTRSQPPPCYPHSADRPETLRRLHQEEDRNIIIAAKVILNRGFPLSALDITNLHVSESAPKNDDLIRAVQAYEGKVSRVLNILTIAQQLPLADKLNTVNADIQTGDESDDDELFRIPLRTPVPLTTLFAFD
ncbi:hypothetical protein DTO021C3_360 [Paecilomyces variotii]|nr:hypothetical protein DTO021C3_360 [Paecilomyces variotii]